MPSPTISLIPSKNSVLQLPILCHITTDKKGNESIIPIDRSIESKMPKEGKQVVRTSPVEEGNTPDSNALGATNKKRKSNSEDSIIRSRPKPASPSTKTKPRHIALTKRKLRSNQPKSPVGMETPPIEIAIPKKTPLPASTYDAKMLIDFGTGKTSSNNTKITPAPSRAKSPAVLPETTSTKATTPVIDDRSGESDHDIMTVETDDTQITFEMVQQQQKIVTSTINNINKTSEQNPVASVSQETKEVSNQKKIPKMQSLQDNQDETLTIETSNTTSNKTSMVGLKVAESKSPKNDESTISNSPDASNQTTSSNPPINMEVTIDQKNISDVPVPLSNSTSQFPPAPETRPKIQPVVTQQSISFSNDQPIQGDIEIGSHDQMHTTNEDEDATTTTSFQFPNEFISDKWDNNEYGKYKNFATAGDFVTRMTSKIVKLSKPNLFAIYHLQPFEIPEQKDQDLEPIDMIETTINAYKALFSTIAIITENTRSTNLYYKAMKIMFINKKGMEKYTCSSVQVNEHNNFPNNLSSITTLNKTFANSLIQRNLFIQDVNRALAINISISEYKTFHGYETFGLANETIHYQSEYSKKLKNQKQDQEIIEPFQTRQKNKNIIDFFCHFDIIPEHSLDNKEQSQVDRKTQNKEAVQDLEEFNDNLDIDTSHIFNKQSENMDPVLVSLLHHVEIVEIQPTKCTIPPLSQYIHTRMNSSVVSDIHCNMRDVDYSRLNNKNSKNNPMIQDVIEGPNAVQNFVASSLHSTIHFLSSSVKKSSNINSMHSIHCLEKCSSFISAKKNLLNNCFPGILTTSFEKAINPVSETKLYPIAENFASTKLEIKDSDNNVHTRPPFRSSKLIVGRDHADNIFFILTVSS